MDVKPQLLLTGASGTVGQEILKQLDAQRDRFAITVFDLKSKNATKILSPYKKVMNIVYGDIANTDELKKVCANKDYVIHLAAIIPPMADDYPQRAYDVNFVGTENLGHYLEHLSPNAFLVYSSSVSVYGDRLEQPFIKVTDALIPSEGDEYAKTKIKAEQAIVGSQLNWSIFRLSAIMGNHKLTKLLFHMPLNTPIEITSPKDTAKAFIQAIENKMHLSKKIFNLGGGETCRIQYNELLGKSFAVFGLGKLNFPAKSFAEKNFHCGYYADGDDLEKILHFRNDTIDDYFTTIKQSTPLLQKLLLSVFKKPIKNYLLKLSEPYKAFSCNNTHEMNHYFKPL